MRPQRMNMGFDLFAHVFDVVRPSTWTVRRSLGSGSVSGRSPLRVAFSTGDATRELRAEPALCDELLDIVRSGGDACLDISAVFVLNADDHYVMSWGDSCIVAARPMVSVVPDELLCLAAANAQRFVAIKEGR
jgi:hypothetical protein